MKIRGHEETWFNYFQPMGFISVERTLAKEAGFKKYLKERQNFVDNFGTMFSVSRFTRAVIFELALRCESPHDALKAKVLRAAVHVLDNWPDVPLAEPFCAHGASAARLSDLASKLMLMLAVLEQRQAQIAAQIKDHRNAIAALTGGKPPVKK